METRAGAPLGRAHLMVAAIAAVLAGVLDFFVHELAVGDPEVWLAALKHPALWRQQ